MARRVNSPWSKTYKEGLPTTAVNDHVDIDRTVVGAITTGVIDSATGQWKGITVTDNAFTIDATHEAVPNSAVVLSPQSAPDYIDMTGYKDVTIAIKPSNGGNYAITAVMGPSHNYYANLNPLNANATLIGAPYPNDDNATLYSDSAQSFTADVWNIVTIQDRLRDQKVLQFRITNNSGGESNIEFAYLRVA